jgi:hypothetical protein
VRLCETVWEQDTSSVSSHRGRRKKHIIAILREDVTQADRATDGRNDSVMLAAGHWPVLAAVQ